jgi:hypothetical protein
MKVLTKTLLAFACAALMAAGASADQAKPAAQAAPAPSAPSRLTPALHGEAQIIMTEPVLKREGKNLVTTFRVKNASKQPIAGFKIEEFWYDKKGSVIGGDTFRYLKPLQPDEIIDVKLEDVATGNESNNNYKFSHANGTVGKPTRVKKF